MAIKNNFYPKISIVTPSFNQAPFLEETILSILNQNYPNLEYIIIDGGSTDGSVEIIKKYQDKLAFWISEPDKGMYDAINKGFRKSTGEIMAYINSDDVYLSGVFAKISSVFEALPEVDWITGKCGYIDEQSKLVNIAQRKIYSQVLLSEGYYQSPYSYVVNQNVVFWRRSLWDKVGGIDPNLKFAGDFYLWVNFAEHAQLYSTDMVLSCFRRHNKQKSFDRKAYVKEAHSIKKPRWRLLIGLMLGRDKYHGCELKAPLVEWEKAGNRWIVSCKKIKLNLWKRCLLIRNLIYYGVIKGRMQYKTKPQNYNRGHANA